MPRLRRPLAVLAVLLASGGLAACGKHHDEEARVQNIENEGFYRSQLSCLMFGRDSDFCQVCRDAIEEIIDLYSKP